jgi:hypothetical protein
MWWASIIAIILLIAPLTAAYKIDLNQKTVQGALLELINTKKNIRWKKIGRYRLFWKVK